MFYIPKEWIRDKRNEEAIHQILNDELYTDINMGNNIEKAIQKLNDIGEITIVEKLKNGTIKIN